MLAKVIDLYRDHEYFDNMRRIALPIIAQQLAFAGLNMLGVVFVGQKGETAVAAVGLAGQLAFLLNLDFCTLKPETTKLALASRDAK